jgi:hypothetical protein
MAKLIINAPRWRAQQDEEPIGSGLFCCTEYTGPDLKIEILSSDKKTAAREIRCVRVC